MDSNSSSENVKPPSLSSAESQSYPSIIPDSTNGVKILKTLNLVNQYRIGITFLHKKY
jgi:hypothetical protein